MECKHTHNEIDILGWENWPNRRKSGKEYSSACPSAGGDNRMRIMPSGGKNGKPGVWCRNCGACGDFNADTGSPHPVIQQWMPPTQVNIDQALAGKWHAQLGDKRIHFNNRGISDAVIDRYLLGYNREWHRLSIPCKFDGKIHAIQYRIDPDNERRMKKAGEEYKKYVSEKGGNNHIPFNTQSSLQAKGYLLVDESPLDALMFESHGYRCISPFSGNNSGQAWIPAWNRYINTDVREIIVIAQNDDVGARVAVNRAALLPNARCVSPPEGVKDFGELICKIPQSERRSLLLKYLCLPPTLG
jgi:hypothetical protein